GATGERVSLGAGAEARGEPFHVEIAGDVRAAVTRWSDALPARTPLGAPLAVELGWNSWYELWDGVDEQAVRDNAARAAEVLGPWARDGRVIRIVVDDGWQVRWGEWEPNAKFPSGLDGLARDLRADGFRMGVWLAPLLVDADSALVAEHPDWFVGDASYVHAKNGEMRILDVTHPDAADHLAGVIRRLVGWGYDLLKIDFLFAGTFEGERREDVTGMEAYARALSIVREAAGEETLLLAVGAPDVASLPWADAWRAGPDIALEPFGPSWPFVTNEARALGARWPICRRVACDGDPPLLRGLTEPEVSAGAWVAAFAGGAFFLSDDLRSLDDARLPWGLDDARVGVALAGEPSVPADPFPESPPDALVNALTDHFGRDHASTHVVPRIWTLPSGGRVALNTGDSDLVVETTTVPPRSVVPLP
ncbi:MAG: alpha-galactosidase, partial [Deltaproteobacteria bacterium]|nr:alpha-galactosidase [Deltaproteobacteria bacterium]